VEEVFNFVANFDCLNHDELINSNNINMIRFMKDVVYLKGEIWNGCCEEKLIVELRNGDIFEGSIKNYKKHGHGEITRGRKKIIGNFQNDNLPYGIIDYGNGT